MKKIVFLLFFFISISVFSNIYEDLIKIEKMIQSNQNTEAINILENYLSNSKNKDQIPKKIYLLSWAYYLNKDYKSAFIHGKKLVLNHPKSSFYYPALFLVIRTSVLLGEKENALKLLDWIITNRPVSSEYLFAAQLFKSLITREYKKDYEKEFPLGVYRLCAEILGESALEKVVIKEVVKTIPEEKKDLKQEDKTKEDLKNQEEAKKQEELKKLEEIKKLEEMKKQEELKRKKETKKPEEKKNINPQIILLGPEAEQLEKLRKEITVKQKELEILRILLEEKKRLLYLKEKYLDEREKLQKE